MLGATTREVAPDALLARAFGQGHVHFRGGAPPAEMRAAATERGLRARRPHARRVISSRWARSTGCSTLRARSSSRTCTSDPRGNRPLRHRSARVRRDAMDVRKRQRSMVHKIAPSRRTTATKSFRTIAVAADLLRQRPVRAGFPAPAGGEFGASHRCGFGWRRKAAISHARVGEIVRLRSLGHADDEGFDPGACRTDGIGPDRGLANARRAARRADREILQRPP